MNIAQTLRFSVAHAAAISLLLISHAVPIFAQSDQFTPAMVTSLIDPYLRIQKGLAADNLSDARQSAEALLKALAKAPKEGAAKEEAQTILAPAQIIAEAKELDTARVAFLPLTREFFTLLKSIGTTRNTPLYLLHCPMAFGNKGGDWIQADKTVANPYFGSSMLRCGVVKAEISQQGTDRTTDKADHQSHH